MGGRGYDPPSSVFSARLSVLLFNNAETSFTESSIANGQDDHRRKRFAAISAVEGIKLTPEMERRAAELDRKGLTPEERIRAIVSAHRKG
jgi:hypothetical protein